MFIWSSHVWSYIIWSYDHILCFNIIICQILWSYMCWYDSHTCTGISVFGKSSYRIPLRWNSEIRARYDISIILLLIMWIFQWTLLPVICYKHFKWFEIINIIHKYKRFCRMYMYDPIYDIFWIVPYMNSYILDHMIDHMIQNKHSSWWRVGVNFGCPIPYNRVIYTT